MPELVLVDGVEEAESFLRWLGERRPVLGVDLETTGLDPWRDRIRLAQFGDSETGWALPYGDWRGLVRHVMSEYREPMIAHNAKFDVSMLEQDGVRVPRHLLHDTMTMCHLVDSRGPKGLKTAASLHVGSWARRGEIELSRAMRKAKWTWATVPVDFEPYWMYGALDPVITCKLGEKLWPQVQYARDAYELEIAVTWVLLDMEARGCRVDLEYCDEAADRLRRELREIEARWPEINLHASQQVADGLRADGVELTKLTEKGNTATDEEVLAGIDHPLARDCLAARERKKTCSTYLDAYTELAVDGILHPNVNPLGAERTGRMSISRPSMQNIPRKALVRDAIIARDGGRLVLADYQAQETRLIAHFSGDPTLTKAFRDGMDVHTFVASQVYGVPMEDVTPEQRRKAKQAGHARNYGAGPKKIALVTGIPFPEAEAFIRRYDREFSRVQVMNRAILRKLREREVNGRGYVVTLSGRRCMVPLEKAYMGTNYLIQGSGSDVMKRGLVAADRSGVARYFVLPVHDEALFDVPVDELEEALPAIHEAMEPDDLTVPLPVETKIVERWGDAYE